MQRPRTALADHRTPNGICCDTCPFRYKLEQEPESDLEGHNLKRTEPEPRERGSCLKFLLHKVRSSRPEQETEQKPEPKFEMEPELEQELAPMCGPVLRPSFNPSGPET